MILTSQSFGGQVRFGQGLRLRQGSVAQVRGHRCGGKDNTQTSWSAIWPLSGAGVVHSTPPKALTGASCNRITRSRCWWALAPDCPRPDNGDGRDGFEDSSFTSTEASSCLVALLGARSGAALKRWPSGDNHE